MNNIGLHVALSCDAIASILRQFTLKKMILTPVCPIHFHVGNCIGDNNDFFFM